MNKYEVEVGETTYKTFVVEAESKDAALDLLKDEEIRVDSLLDEGVEETFVFVRKVGGESCK